MLTSCLIHVAGVSGPYLRLDGGRDVRAEDHHQRRAAVLEEDCLQAHAALL